VNSEAADCPETLKVAALPWATIVLAGNQLMGILIAFKVLQNVFTVQTPKSSLGKYRLSSKILYCGNIHKTDDARFLNTGLFYFQ
jgi:hypothetical protein